MEYTEDTRFYVNDSVKGWIDELSMTKTEFCKVVGFNSSGLSNYLSKRRGLPYDKAETMAKALGKPFEEVFELPGVEIKRPIFVSKSQGLQETSVELSPDLSKKVETANLVGVWLTEQYAEAAKELGRAERRDEIALERFDIRTGVLASLEKLLSDL